MKEYHRDELSERVISWQASDKDELPRSLWKKVYDEEHKQGLKLKNRYRGVDIQDPIQDVAAATPQIARDYAGRARFSTVIGSAIRNTAITYFRKKLPYQHRDEEFFARMTRNNTEEASEVAQYHEMEELVYETMEELPASQRRLLMYAIAELPYEVMAGLLNTDENAVKGRLRRARSNFRKIFRMHPTGEEYMKEHTEAIMRTRRLRTKSPQ